MQKLVFPEIDTNYTYVNEDQHSDLFYSSL